MPHSSAASSTKPAAERVTSDAPLALPLVGSSDAARRAAQSFELAAGRRTPVLVVAEAGCRPSTIVQALHGLTRARAPFLVIDCGAAEPADLDRRLFGTPPRRGASRDLEAIGLDAALAQAAGGTLFLENIDELPASTQRRLARVLRDGETRLASAPRAVALTLRLAASTTGDLDTEAREGRFRRDLLRRVSASRILVPPIRQRPSDLPAIVERMVSLVGGPPRSFTQPAMTVLAALPWAENFDELAGVLGAVLAAAGAIVTQEDVLAHVPIDGAFARMDLTASLREAKRRFERDYIAAVLERHRWRMSDAARTLGIERANLYRKTRQLGIVRVPPADPS
jgi:DNA-binding NtrC family response regulator